MGAALYDEVPYPSVLFPQTHPDRLATLATLYGLRSAPVERCRVLELGCHDGTNLIPMALGLPGSRFVGIDVAAGALARGRETIEALGLDNVTLCHEDLRIYAAQRGDEEPFDYVVAHGVYSWVPDDAREALLDVCRRVLAPHGVAYVSYNAYPGSHLRDMVREMLLYHAAGSESGPHAIARAQAFARVLADVLPPDRLGLLTESLRDARDRAPGALFHDELAPDHRPVYVHEFLGRAGEHGLQFLAEADFPDMQPIGLPPGATEILRAVEQERGRVAREQYLDFFKLRRFRQTLLCRADVAVGGTPAAAGVRSLLVSSRVSATAAEPSLAPSVVEGFGSPSGATIQIDLPTAKAALLVLDALRPRRLPFAELLERAGARLAAVGLAGPNASDADALAEILFECYSVGLVDLHVHEPVLATEAGDRPIASPLARLQASRDDAPSVATLLHTPLSLDDPLARNVIRLLDGTRDRTALLAELRRAPRDGRTATEVGDVLPPEPGVAEPGRALSEVTAEELESRLRELARRGVLVA